MDAILNVLGIAALLGAGGVVFVAVCMALVRALEILEEGE